VRVAFVIDVFSADRELDGWHHHAHQLIKSAHIAVWFNVFTGRS
jgi:hypothetical protein